MTSIGSAFNPGAVYSTNAEAAEANASRQDEQAGTGGAADTTSQQPSPEQATPAATETAQGIDLRSLPGAHQSCVYTQSTGNLLCHDSHGNETINHNGYAGRNVEGGVQGRNNPDAQHVRNTGPLPVGHYTIGAAENRRSTGPVSLPLIPDATNNMYGRSGFFAHGDNPRHDASHGCIIMPRNIREQLHAGDRLEVVR